MFHTLCILGRQPALGLAELESLFGADNVQPLDGAALLNVPVKDVPFERLGGTIKLCKVLAPLPTQNWNELMDHLKAAVPHHLEHLGQGKLKVGLSVHGLAVDVATINRSTLALKKIIKNAGRSVRIVPNKELELNSAQVLHNSLTGPLGWELVLISRGSETILAQTIQIQDIEAYAARDQGRPKRDARVGMLPPKLAQIIINLAQQAGAALTVLDPFCGTGVILQEALLMGYPVIGSDLEPRMIEYARTNLDWLATQHAINNKYSLEVADAASHKWEPMPSIIASETYLGRPFSALPDRTTLEDVARDVDTIHKKFLRNAASQTRPGFRMCIAVPAWNTPDGFKHLRTLDSLEELGYTRTSFVHAANADLVYHREGQIVARELVVLVRK